MTLRVKQVATGLQQTIYLDVNGFLHTRKLLESLYWGTEEMERRQTSRAVGHLFSVLPTFECYI